MYGPLCCSTRLALTKILYCSLAIVFSPVLFHDDSETIANLASNQAAKMLMLEALITHYTAAFPQPYEATYKPPARPGEVRTLGVLCCVFFGPC